MAEFFAYTDGACSGNPGPGGWGALLQAKDGDKLIKERALKGGEATTTNNRMELLAAINALETLGKPCAITVVTDSQYVKNGVTSWIHGWKRNGWKTAAKKPVKNADLWQRLDAAQARHHVAPRTAPTKPKATLPSTIRKRSSAAPTSAPSTPIAMVVGTLVSMSISRVARNPAAAPMMRRTTGMVLIWGRRAECEGQETRSGISKPRRKSAASIARLPGRWARRICTAPEPQAIVSPSST